MKCGVDGDTACMARQGDQCMEHLITDTPSCPSRVPLTNADRIRAMSDEEMAAMMYSFEDLKMPDYCQRKKECDDMLDSDTDIPDENCIGCLIDWLRQPAKEAQHE